MPTISLLFYYYFQKKMKTYFWMGVYFRIISIIGIVQIFREAFSQINGILIPLEVLPWGKRRLDSGGISSALCLLIFNFLGHGFIFIKNKTEEGKYLLYGIPTYWNFNSFESSQCNGHSNLSGGNFSCNSNGHDSLPAFQNDPFNLK